MSETTTQMQDFLTRQAKVCHDNCEIEKDLYKELGVKRGLRDVDGVGVLAGLTNISCIQSSEMINGEKVPCEGKLFYRGYNIYELVDGFMKRGEFGFEETIERIQRNFGAEYDTSKEFHKRCYFKGTIERHYEHVDKEHFNTGIV